MVCARIRPSPGGGVATENTERTEDGKGAGHLDMFNAGEAVTAVPVNRQFGFKTMGSFKIGVVIVVPFPSFRDRPVPAVTVNR